MAIDTLHNLTNSAASHDLTQLGLFSDRSFLLQMESGVSVCLLLLFCAGSLFLMDRPPPRKKDEEEYKFIEKKEEGRGGGGEGDG